MTYNLTYTNFVIIPFVLGMLTLLWLKKEFLKTPKDERTPTKNAIIKWITAVLDNRV